MTYFPRTSIQAADSPSIDAFGRWRVSEPTTLFDSKQLFDKDPIFWDEAITGSGGTSTHSPYTASTVMAVGTSAATVVRQTFERFNYQAGKSHLVLMTGVLDKSGGGTGITRRFGYFDANNGIFLEDAEGVISLVCRSSVSGSPSDSSKVVQASWNMDPMDGSGPSGIIVDWSKSQILLIEMEWLGVGRVRVGLVIDGSIHYVHAFNHANVISGVYMSTPNLPLRWEITNDGAGAASSMEHICGSVMVEGGMERTGVLRTVSTAGVHLDAAVADQLYMLLAIRLKPTHIGASVVFKSAEVLNETDDFFEWEVILNPTIAGTPTWVDLTDSAVQYTLGATANTVSGGYLIQSGWGSDSSVASGATFEMYRHLGNSLSGVSDVIALCVRSRALNADFNGSMTWQGAR